MKVFFRVDASNCMGTGHLMRCLTLAEALRKRGAETRFICRAHPGNLVKLLQRQDMPVTVLPAPVQTPTMSSGGYATWLGVTQGKDAEQTIDILRKTSITLDWLVVDHYALDRRWETQMRSFSKKIMVIDDLADRPHDCDLLLDQNLYENLENRYDGLVPEQCRKLLGPKYVLLRPEFMEARRKMRGRDGCVRRILIFFGGCDPTNETAKALEAILLLNKPDISVDVVVGEGNPHKKLIKELCLGIPKAVYHCQVQNMASLMLNADLSIGSGGTATWERLYLGLPTIALVLAQNQFETTAAVAKKRAAWNLGWKHNIRAENIAKATRKAINNRESLKEMGKNALYLMADKSECSVLRALASGVVTT